MDIEYGDMLGYAPARRNNKRGRDEEKSYYVAEPRVKASRRKNVSSGKPLSEYNIFCKTHYDEVRYLPVKERMAALGQMWRQSGNYVGSAAPRARKTGARQTAYSRWVDKYTAINGVRPPAGAWENSLQYVPATKAVRAPRAKAPSTRAPTAYQRFVKANYDRVRDLPPKQRLGAIAVMWREHQGRSVWDGGYDNPIGGGVRRGGRVR